MYCELSHKKAKNKHVMPLNVNLIIIVMYLCICKFILDYVPSKYLQNTNVNILSNMKLLLKKDSLSNHINITKYFQLEKCSGLSPERLFSIVLNWS